MVYLHWRQPAVANFLELFAGHGEIRFRIKLRSAKGGPMTNPNADADTELLRRTRAGDEEAFIRLYHERQASIYRFALQMSGSPSLAEDVTQEVFLTVMREARKFDPRRGPLAAYLYGIARNLVADHLRQTRWESGLARGDEEGEGSGRLKASGDPLTDMTRREAGEALRQAILVLPRHYREVVVLCELHEMDCARAAKILGCAVGTVRSRLCRARGLLAKRLGAKKKEPAGEGVQHLKATRWAL